MLRDGPISFHSSVLVPVRGTPYPEGVRGARSTAEFADYGRDRIERDLPSGTPPDVPQSPGPGLEALVEKSDGTVLAAGWQTVSGHVQAAPPGTEHGQLADRPIDSSRVLSGVNDHALQTARGADPQRERDLGRAGSTVALEPAETFVDDLGPGSYRPFQETR